MNTSFEITEQENIEVIQEDYVLRLYNDIKILKNKLKNKGLSTIEYDKQYTIAVNYIWKIYPIHKRDINGEEQQILRTKYIRQWRRNINKSFNPLLIQEEIDALQIRINIQKIKDAITLKEDAAIKRNTKKAKKAKKEYNNKRYNNFIMCSCGKEISKQHMNLHLITKIHLKNNKTIETSI